jgi:hypothetical protein
MNQTILKYEGIKYPLFTFKKKPLRLVFDGDKLLCTSQDGVSQTIDDKSLSGSYFERLLQLKQRAFFDNTCRNLQDILFSKAQWGIDSQGKPHDLSKKYKVPAVVRTVKKIEKNIVWVQGISYPFELPTTESIELKDIIFAKTILVNGEWYLREFSYENDSKLTYMYI